MNIYRFNGGVFEQVQGTLMSIAVGSDGSVWGVNPANQVYRFNGASFEQVQGTLTSIAVGSDGTVWGINPANQIYRFNGAALEQVQGALASIAVGSAGAVWGLALPATPSQLDFDTGVITFPSPIPLGGSAHVTLHQDGSYNFVGHFHLSSIVTYAYGVALTVLDRDNRLYTFTHKYSFNSGPNSDDFPYSGNNPAIAQNWSALVSGASFRWEADANFDVDGLISGIEKAIQEAGPIISAVISVVGAL
jgi:hypothetical protein